MANSISPGQFHEAEGVEDWRVVAEGACAYFRAATVAAGGTLVSDAQAPSGCVLADPEGNEACIGTWQSRN